MRMRPQILCIIGDSRSGSTLLQYLLATQPGVAAVGELRRLAQLVREGRPCSCGRALHECPRWGPILARLDLRPQPRPRVSKRAGEAAGLLAGVPLGRPAARRAVPAAARAADQAATVYRLLGEQEQCRVIVDSSKDPGHALELALNGEITVHPLYLFRDGRAVVHSKVRRTNIDPDVAIRHWRRLTTGMLWLRRLRAGTTVHYEDLCADPRAALFGGQSGLSRSERRTSASRRVLAVGSSRRVVACLRQRCRRPQSTLGLLGRCATFRALVKRERNA